MKKNRSRWILALVTLVVLLAFAFPFIWMLLASFKTQSQIMSTGQF
ncbi:MAG: carbohydrate transporter permease, partial [Paenibacillus sp.]|nr:carbohydrate transporter permease [Paenibacillus sp.]